MDDQQTQVNWQLISDAIAKGLIPSPAGSNENGEPYWIINDQQVTWQQVQAFVIQAQQQAGSESSGGIESGGGIESVPQMPITPNFEAQETRVESQVETSPERAPERSSQQPQVNSQPKPKQSLPTTPAAKPQKGPSLLGQSAALKSVDTSDPQSMLSFVQQNKSQPSDSSNKFLAEFLEKVLQVLSIDVNN